MTKLLFLCKRFPLVLDLGRLILPLLADDLGDLWVGKTRILSDDLGLMVLTVQDESYAKSVPELIKIVWYASFLPLRGLGILGSGWQIQTCAVESPLLARVCTGVVLALSSSLSSSSTVPALRFLVDLEGGLSSGVKGVFEPPERL